MFEEIFGERAPWSLAVLLSVVAVAVAAWAWNEDNQETRRHVAVVEACADADDRDACVTAFTEEED